MLLCEIDDRFASKTIMPGFIDQHLYPLIGVIPPPPTFITASEWKLPYQRIAATRGRDAYLKEVAHALKADDGTKLLFVTWGYTQIWHGGWSSLLS